MPDKMIGTRDINVFLTELKKVYKQFLVIATVKESFSGNNSIEIINALRELGFSNITGLVRRLYVGVLNKGEVIFDKSGEKENYPVEYNDSVCGIQISAVSKSVYHGNSAEITINNVEYSYNDRGINLVIYDIDNRQIIDSVNFDPCPQSAVFYRKNLFLNKEYFNAHFFLPEKYQKAWFSVYQRNYHSNRVLSV